MSRQRPGVALGYGGAKPSRARPVRPYVARQPKLPTAHLEAHDRGRVVCGRPWADAVLADRTTRQPPEGYRLCGQCHRRSP